ncbi:hypothetical protein GOP47_0011368 [Adiantum capillus-veneris]|uniref:Aromatic amino acid beta-eliminating lyase/threonine aldolase domain-containing protein n=1 Tax=Adiantum capillus-veneris TaxID=13818 RepID=A0A9D4UT44_ADICA|nr:hypothetical protein GOP47_0011368 [Adiantum capillus-veneris]
MADLQQTVNGCVKRIVDLRSDTVTKPTLSMRQAMASSEVDDDVLGVDPTADRLQKQMAQVCGKDAGLFVASGTMGNLISVLVHCEVRGSEAIIGSESHIHLYEQGGISTLGHVYSHIVPNETDGTMDLTKVEAAIRANDVHFPTTRLICIENTHGSFGGRCISPEYTDKLGALAKRYNSKLHIDGARIFNAATALKVPVERLVQSADSVSVCLSKGLGAPIGSVIVGSFEFIAKARRLRKALGGGMRQLGVLAAPALISLNDIAGKLHIDHQHACLLAEGLCNVKGLHVDLGSVETNMVFAEVKEDSRLSAQQICEALKDHGVLVMALSKDKIRAVLHHQISQDDVKHAIVCFQDVLAQPTESNGCLS